MKKTVLTLLAALALLFPCDSMAGRHQTNEYGACFANAGFYYGVAPDVLWAIAKVESEFNPRAINRNTNGSFDYGIMQINTWWYPKLGKELWNSLGDPCTNIHVGAWVLAQCVQQHGNTWEAVGCYNAKSKDKRNAYAWKVYRALTDSSTNTNRKAARSGSGARIWRHASTRAEVGAIGYAQAEH